MIGKLVILVAMVLAGIGNAWGEVLFHDDFIGHDVVPNPLKWTDVGPNKGSTEVDANQLRALRTDMIRTIQTFDATVPGQPLTFSVDVTSPPLAASGGADFAEMRVYTSSGPYLKVRLYDYQGYGGSYGVAVILLRSTGEIIFSKYVSGATSSYPMTINLTLDTTNTALRLVNGPYGNDVLWSGAHGVTGLAVARLGLTNGNTGSNGYEYFNARMDNAMVTSGLVLEGKVALGDYIGDPRAIGALIELRQNGSAVKTALQVLNSDGTFMVEGVAPGTYDLAVKTYLHRQKVLVGISINTNRDIGTIDLPSGDCDGDNEVTSTDLSILLANMEPVE